MPWVAAPGDAGRFHACGWSACPYAPLYIDRVCMFTQRMLVHITGQCRGPAKREGEKRGSAAMTSPPHMADTTGLHRCLASPLLSFRRHEGVAGGG